jgi:hypothetical protein
MFKNPVFPFYNGIFKSTYYTSTNFIDERWFPKTLLGKLFYPFKFVNTQSVAADVPFRDPRFAVLFIILVIVALSYVLRRFVLKRQHLLDSIDRREWVFWIFLLTSYVVWEKQFSYYRYIVVIELLVLIAIALIILRLVKHLYIAMGLGCLLFILITVRTIPMDWGRIPWQPDYFGPSLRQQLQNANGAVLMTGQDPSGFLVPYLPAGSRAIRIQGNLTYPPLGGTTAEKSLINAAVNKAEKEGNSFFALETTNREDEQTSALYEAGFSKSSCTTLDTYVGQYLFFGTVQYQLCNLEPNAKIH